MTELIRGLKHIKDRHKGAVVTIGNFDGVHLGHQQLIERVKQIARESGAPSMVITFEPHPAEFFCADPVNSPQRLTTFKEKFTQLCALDVDYVLLLTFNQGLADLSASRFIQDILCDLLQVHTVCIGEDFRFGRNRTGDVKLLAQMQAGRFVLQVVPAYDLAGEKISSTRIRAALAQGNLSLAQVLLNRRYSIRGRVIRGDQRGRSLGFPTANIHLQRKVPALSGVFTVLVHEITPSPLPAVANIGLRPTVDGTRIILEVHLLNFNEAIYNRHVTVEFCSKLRDEIRFPNVEELKNQIADDVLAAKEFFMKQGV